MPAASPIRRPRRSRTYWARMVTEHDASGLSARAFCNQRKLSVKTFTRWKHRLAGEGAKSEPSRAPTFIELPVAPTPTAAASGGWELELDLGEGLRLRLRRT